MIRALACAFMSWLLDEETWRRQVSFAARQKFRLDLGQSFLSYATFIMASVTASPVIGGYLGISPRLIVAVMVPVVIVAVWFGGYLLDRAKFYNHYQDVLNEKNELLQQLRKEKDGN